MDSYKQELLNYTKSNGEPLSKASVSFYLRNIKVLSEKTTDWKIDNLNVVLKDYTLKHKINFYNSIINYLTCMKYPKNQISMYIQERENLTLELQGQPKINPKKEQNLLDWDEIITWRETLTTNNKTKTQGDYIKLRFEDIQLELLLTLYTNIPRRNEFADCFYIRTDNPVLDPQIPNVIFYNTETKKHTISLKDYKTQNNYGEFNLKIPTTTELHNLLLLFNEYHGQHKISDTNKPYRMFLTTKDRKPMDRLNLTKTLQRSSKKILGKNISTNMIRHSFATSKYKDIKQQLITDAHLLSHNPSTTLNEYVIT